MGGSEYLDGGARDGTDEGTLNRPSEYICGSCTMQPCLTGTTSRVPSDSAVPSSYDMQVARLSPSERFLRALALSAGVRGLAWEGARLNAVTPDTAGVVLRFVRQLYGDDVALMWQRRTAARNRK